MVKEPIRLVIKPSWGIYQQQGCCGMGVITRLNSATCTPSQRDANRDSWLALVEPKPLMSDLPNWRSAHLKTMLNFLDRRPQGMQWMGRRQSTRWYGGAVSTHVAFMAVVEDAMKNQRYSMYFLSDNTEGVGDVHNGPFSTRNFVKWLRDNDMGAIHSPGPVTSLRTQRELQSWIFVPNTARCDAQVEHIRKEFIIQVNEINDNDKIKCAENDRRREQELASKAIRDSLSTNWGSYEYTS